MTLVKFTRLKIYSGKLTTGKTFYHGVCNGTYCYAFTASVMYHFWSENRLQLFQILFAPPPSPPPKTTQIEIFKNPVVDLIRRIHKESGFNGFMIRLWICPKKRKIKFWIRKSWFWFSPTKKRTESIEDSEKEGLLLTVGFMLDFLVYLTVTLQWVLLPRLHLKTV